MIDSAYTVIEPLDTSSSSSSSSEPISNKRKQPETTEVWMEPTKLSDFVVKYDNMVFHVHKSVLAVQSGHFETLFSLDLEAQETEIPIQYEMINQEIVSGEEFHTFLKWMYKPCSVAFIGNFTDLLFSIGYLVHYFEVPTVKNVMEDKARDLVSELYGHEIPLLNMYLAWTVYEWSLVKIDDLIKMLDHYTKSVYYGYPDKYKYILSKLPRWAERVLLIGEANARRIAELKKF